MYLKSIMALPSVNMLDMVKQQRRYKGSYKYPQCIADLWTVRRCKVLNIKNPAFTFEDFLINDVSMEGLAQPL